jgi:hypothetical protein
MDSRLGITSSGFSCSSDGLEGPSGSIGFRARVEGALNWLERAVLVWNSSFLVGLVVFGYRLASKG